MNEITSLNNRVDLITYADGNYIQHACILLLSLKDVISSSRQYYIFIFYSSCTKEDLRKLKLSLEGNLPPNVSYILTECNYDLAFNLKAKEDHMTAGIYNKIFIYDQLPPGMEKILFLDADIVLLRDPGELYDLDLDDHLVAAVKEPVFHKMSKSAQEAIGVEKDQYFNSGVMLVNIRKWLEYEIPNKSIEFCIEKWNLTPYHDQDALNYSINGNWLEISPLWNPRIINHWIDDQGKTHVKSKYELYEQGLSYLVHYSGPGKPWFYMSFHPKKELYLKYLKQSEFRNYQFPDFNTVNVIKKKYLKVRRNLYYLRQKLHG